MDGDDLGSGKSFKADEALPWGGLARLSLVLTQRTWCERFALCP